jgi:acetyl esterase/lipase
MTSQRDMNRRQMKLSQLPGILFALSLASRIAVAAEFPAEIPLWPKGAPGSGGNTAPEIVSKSASGELSVSSIHNPSLTPYLPAKEKATGTAILVIPGGGHRVLAITHEGYNVAEWFSAHGIAAFVLKHRLARETNSTYKIEVESLDDTKRAMRLIRSRAAEWHIDTAHIGAIGFSAGGELVNLVCARFDHGQTDASDPVERQPCRPDFQALIYPGRSADIQPTNGFPPVFLACSYTDRKDISEGLAETYLRFKRAGVPAELHIYTTGGHGFGLRATNNRPVGAWITRFDEWMADSGFVKR